MPETLDLLALGGDGIGPEVTGCALKVVEKACDSDTRVDITEDLLHGACYDEAGTFLKETTLDHARRADAVLVGATGGPRWDHIRPAGEAAMSDGLMQLRMELDTFAGLRPARAIACLEPLTPYRPGLTDGADVLVLREMTGGNFFSAERGVDRSPQAPRRGYDLGVYDEHQVARFAHVGFRLAERRRRHLVSADKSNVMEMHVLWREVVSEVALDYPGVTLEHLYADNASYQLARDPGRFDVIMADNLFGDMLSDQAGVIVAGLGMLPSACLTGFPDDATRVRGIFEPVHGSAPDIAGEGIANPVGAILSVAMMFDYAFGRADIARAVEGAVTTALEAGARTRDLGGRLSSAAMTDAIIAELEA
ncbi:MAG: 3-isopropylmalate dehydrogenase [bacterium]|nr:3-isopropylmalate dehydrogenase [bacterium]